MPSSLFFVRCREHTLAAAWVISQAALIMCAGCGGAGDGRAAVEGQVLFDGAPVESGVITFISEQGPSAGAEISNGRYAVASDNGPAIGANRVEVSWSKKTGKQIPVGSPAPAGSMTDETKEAIPRKYNKESTLSVEIKAGENTFDLNLES